VFPLSFAQRRLWFLHQFDPASPAYNILIPMRFNVPVNRTVLERAANELVRRHEALRTTFQMVNGEPMQVVAPSLTITLAYSDLRSAAIDKEEAAASVASLEAQRPFSLSAGPLIRMGLHRLGETDHLLLICMHHIVSDGWSVGVLFRELNALYTTFSTGSAPNLPPLRVQYADFAHWQLRMLTGKTLQKLLGYWRRQLAGAPEVLTLPADRSRPAAPSGRGGAYATMIGAPLYDQVRALAQCERATPFMVLMAVFQVLLFRHTAETDLVIGTPIANRRKPELEDLIGLFVNTLVIRTNLSGDPAFRELLGRVREAALGAYAHQDMPFELLVEELQPSRRLNLNPLFQVMFLLQSVDPSNTGATESQSAKPVHIATIAAKFDLTVSINETPQAANVVVEYNADLFDSDTIKRLMDRFVMLIESAVTRLETPISALEYCGAAELRALQPAAGPRPDAPLHEDTWECVKHWAEVRPDASAITAGDHTIAYQVLAQRVETRASHLAASGFSPGSLVPLCFDYSIDSIATMLAANQLGAVFIHASGPGTSFASSEEPLAGDVACVLPVSGVDGRVRGVQIPPQALTRVDLGHKVQILSSDTVLYCVHLEDEFNVFMICAALAAGAHLVPVSPNPAPSPRKIASLMRDHGITVAVAPVEMLDCIARDFPWAMKALRLALAHEEPAATAEVDEALWPKLFYLNGAAEAGGCAFVCPATIAPPSLGLVAAGMTVHLLDDAMRPTPEGAVGEVFFASLHLARGYQDDAAATATCFPASLYRSGQLARRGAGGVLMLCGRRNRRTYIQGVRLEPQALEAALEQHPDVTRAAVVRSRRGLAAYLTTVKPIAEKELAAHLGGLFSLATVPVAWRVVESLPLNTDGQIDWKKLERMENEHQAGALATAYLAPHTDVESRLAMLWGTFFGKARISVRDNFFQLGGHSLLATRLLAQIAEEFGAVVSVKEFFAAPTIEGLAALTSRNQSAPAKGAPPVIPSLERGSAEEPVDVEQLSDADVDRMLAALLEEQAGPETNTR